ncbi:MAG TPA: RraA family protein [Alphaproteobacteria bacterium]|nr:RraA family protein [Alphaproteobacteria bacterium]
MPEFATAREMFDLMAQKLASSVLSDVLDTQGYRDQVMRAAIRPLSPEAVVAGRAMPVLYAEVFEIPDKPYQMEIEVVDSLRPDDVLVAYAPATAKAALWGGLLSTAARARGARGAVIDGMTRDVKQITGMAFPVFVRGVSPLDAKGRLRAYAYRCAIECGGVLVEPGDIIFGDADGVVVIPQDVAVETVSEALHKVEAERLTEEELKKGSLLRDVYARYGVL